MTNASTIRFSPRHLFRFFAFTEAVTWTLLLGGLAFRAAFGAPPTMLTIVGGIHGVVFLGYGVVAALVGVNNRWGGRAHGFGNCTRGCSLRDDSVRNSNRKGWSARWRLASHGNERPA